VIETAARASPSPPSTGAATHAIPREDSSCEHDDLEHAIDKRAQTDHLLIAEI